MKKIMEKNFNKIVENGEKPVIVIFAGEWCPDCNALLPYYKQLEEKYGDNIVFARAHVGKEKKRWPQKFDFTYIPTFIIFKEGEVWKKFCDEEKIGNIEAAIKEIIET